MTETYTAEQREITQLQLKLGAAEERGRCMEHAAQLNEENAAKLEAALSAIREAPIPELKKISFPPACRGYGIPETYAVLTALTRKVAALEAENSQLKAKGDATKGSEG